MPFVCEYFFVLSGPPVSGEPVCGTRAHGACPGLPVHVRACCADPGWDLTQASQVLVGIFGMGIAGPRAWHPPFPAWGAQQGPAHHTGGFALLAVCPLTLFSCSGITNSPSSKSFWTLCFMVWGLWFLGLVELQLPSVPALEKGWMFIVLALEKVAKVGFLSPPHP